MKTNNIDYIKEFSIKQLFQQNSDDFLIPIYQRNYEWGSGQIVQLLEDIRDYYLYNASTYYIGTLIVNKRKENERSTYETIDGQQRLTTFNILIGVVKNTFKSDMCAVSLDNVNPEDDRRANLDFESRPLSKKTIDYIYRNGATQPNMESFNENIIGAAKIIEKQLQLIKEELKDSPISDKSFGGFLKYLFENVILLRVQVPKYTNLNHYFEIMNSRGEQLERHEILKAELMSKIKGPENEPLRKVYHGIWEACSRMETYVQLGFPKKMRASLFGGRWFSFIPENENELFSTLKELYAESGAIKAFGIDEILTIGADKLNDIKKGLSEENMAFEPESEYRQFHEVINFENFLLHVLKLTVAEYPKDKLKEEIQAKEVSLDDKKLIDFFKAVLTKVDDEAYFSRVFMYTLLKSRFLLDQYVLKRKYVSQKDEWSLNVIKFYEKGKSDRSQDSYSYINTFVKNDENREVILLLSMFHVSTPTLSYKNWLYEVLLYLSNNYDFKCDHSGMEYPQNIKAELYIDNLRKIAVKFLKYRILNSERNLSYDEMLDEASLKEAVFNPGRLAFGNIKSNLVFNFLDYLLWKIGCLDANLVDDFEFSFRSSVEHYYPQNPRTVAPIKDEKVLNSIGNLCLISHNNNSKLSNHSPAEKRRFFENSKSKESIKQMVMMKENVWNEDTINRHSIAIHELFKKIVFEKQCSKAVFKDLSFDTSPKN